MKQRRLVQDLRSSIGAGDLAPGQQLPTRREFKALHGVSGITIDRALSALSRDGFIRSVQGGAVYVANRPPNVTRFGLVFPWRPSPVDSWSLYWRALQAAALQIEKLDGIEIPIYYDIASHAHNTRDFDRLVDAVESDQLAGLIFAHSPHHLVGTPVLDHPGLPRVALMEPLDIPGVTQLRFDYTEYLDSVMRHFANTGRKKLAILSACHLDGLSENTVLKAKAREFGLELPDWRIHSVHPATPAWAEHTMNLLFRLPLEERPDALLIRDDNLVEQAQRGLLAAGIGPDSGLEIVAHCNWPTPPARILPMSFIGFDALQIMRQCIELIRGQRRAPAEVGLSIVPVIFKQSSQNSSAETSSVGNSSASFRRSEYASV